MDDRGKDEWATKYTEDKYIYVSCKYWYMYESFFVVQFPSIRDRDREREKKSTELKTKNKKYSEKFVCIKIAFSPTRILLFDQKVCMSSGWTFRLRISVLHNNE